MARFALNPDLRVPFIQLDDLLKNKCATGRAQDIADIDVLSRRRS
jgi:hypothetical protein